MSADPVRAIADAVLYEGYILWPYRRSALKNQRRFTFGGVYPPAHSEAHPDDPSTMRTEVLLRGAPPARVEVTVRFLQVVQREVAGADGRLCNELVVGSERHLAWEEALEREVCIPATSIQRLARGRSEPIEIPAGRIEEAISDESRRRAGTLIRSWERLQGEVAVRAASGADATRLSVEIRNTTLFGGESRQEVLRRTFCSTHTLLHAEGGAYVSLADPPPELRGAAAACRNAGTWPVLVGDPGDATTVLSSPIILEDYPRIAPESPGDLFDGGEIDQLLTLNILAMTDEEKAEMLATDPRAREILERTEALAPEQLLALHGTIREFGMARPR